MITQIKDMQNEYGDVFGEGLQALKELIPVDYVEHILSQEGQREGYDYAGYAMLYKTIAGAIDKSMKVIDIGCYLAPQSFLFSNHRKYIGVDKCKLERFRSGNTEQYIGTAQQFLLDSGFDKMSSDELGGYYVIIAYDMDEITERRIRDLFPNVVKCYPM